MREDRDLIRYLMRHRHTSPFEMCEIKLHVRAPMDTWRQWIRHRTANVNEYSTRYSVAIDSAKKTSPAEWRKQSPADYQGSEGSIDEETGHELSIKESEIHYLCKSVYQHRLSVGVAREQARKDLPLSTYTEAYWKIDLHNLLHFLSLRMASRAQLEIRSYANIIGNDIVARWCPMTWEAFLDYRFNALSLSETEIKIIQQIAIGNNDNALQLARQYGLITSTMENGATKPTREGQELELKLNKLGISAPWK